MKKGKSNTKKCNEGTALQTERNYYRVLNISFKKAELLYSSGRKGKNININVFSLVK